MDLERLARMVAEAQDELGMSDYRLEHELGVLPDGKVFNAKQLDRWKRGLRTQPVPRPVVAKLIDVLGLDWAEAWAASGLLPTHVTAEDLRTLESFRQRPLEPALARAGGSDTPTAFSLRTTRSTPHQQGSTTGTLIVVPAERWRRRENRVAA